MSLKKYFNFEEIPSTRSALKFENILKKEKESFSKNTAGGEGCGTEGITHRISNSAHEFLMFSNELKASVECGENN